MAQTTTLVDRSIRAEDLQAAIDAIILTGDTIDAVLPVNHGKDGYIIIHHT